MAATYTNKNVKFDGKVYSSYVVEVIGTDTFLITAESMDSKIAADVELLDVAIGPLPAVGGINATKTFMLDNGTSFYDTYRGIIKKVGAAPEHASPVDGNMKYWDGANWVAIV
jgi:hypothetical protein